MVLMVMIVTALSGFQRTLRTVLPAETSTNSSGGMAGSKATARDFVTCQLAGQPNADIAAGCVSISVTLVSPGGREGERPACIARIVSSQEPLC